MINSLLLAWIMANSCPGKLLVTQMYHIGTALFPKLLILLLSKNQCCNAATHWLTFRYWIEGNCPMHLKCMVLKAFLGFLGSLCTPVHWSIRNWAISELSSNYINQSLFISWMNRDRITERMSCQIGLSQDSEKNTELRLKTLVFEKDWSCKRHGVTFECKILGDQTYNILVESPPFSYEKYLLGQEPFVEFTNPQET